MVSTASSITGAAGSCASGGALRHRFLNDLFLPKQHGHPVGDIAPGHRRGFKERLIRDIGDIFRSLKDRFIIFPGDDFGNAEIGPFHLLRHRFLRGCIRLGDRPLFRRDPG